MKGISCENSIQRVAPCAASAIWNQQCLTPEQNQTREYSPELSRRRVILTRVVPRKLSSLRLLICGDEAFFISQNQKGYNSTEIKMKLRKLLRKD